MNKIKNLLKGSPIAIVVVGLVIAGIASAALVDYLSNTIISDNEVIESPIEITSEGTWQWDIEVGGNSDITMLTFKNRAEVTIAGVIEVSVEEYRNGGWVIFDGEGIELALTDDVNYARNFDEGYNPTELPWREWLSENPDWMDWVVSTNNTDIYATTEISPLVDGDGRDGFLSAEGNNDNDGEYVDGFLLSFDDGSWTTPEMDLEAGQIHDIAFWLVSEPNINPGTYRISVTVIPTPTQ